MGPYIKQFISLIAGASLLLFGLSAEAATAPSPASFQVEASQRSVAPGDEVTIAVKEASANDLYSFQLTITFDPETFELRNAELDKQFGKSGVNAVLMKELSNGKLKVIGTRIGQDRGVQGTVGLVQLQFKAKQAKDDAVFAAANDSSWSSAVSKLYVQQQPAEARVTVKAASQQLPPVFIPPVGGGGGGGSGGTGTDGGTAPGLAPAPDSAGERQALVPAIRGSDAKVTATKLSDGRAASKIEVSGSKLVEMFGLLGQVDQEQKVAVPVNAQGQARLDVHFPAAALAEALQKAPEGIISIQTGAGSYELPIRALAISSVAERLGAAPAHISIRVSIETVAASTAQSIAAEAKAAGMTTVGVPFDYSIAADVRGKLIELTDFNGVFIERTVPLPAGTSAGTATLTGALYDPARKAFRFVPTYFVTGPNGQTEAVMKRSGNSIYTIVQADKRFDDLNGHWAGADVHLLASKLVVNGVNDRQFAPDSPITRAQFAALLARSLGFDDEADPGRFTDVSADDWFAGPLAAAVRRGLVDGYDDGTFQPNDRITREQMAVMIAKAMKLAGKPPSLSASQLQQALQRFADQQPISSWAERSVAQVVHAGIMNGVGEGRFAPSAPATRAQAAVILKRMLQALKFMN